MRRAWLTKLLGAISIAGILILIALPLLSLLLRTPLPTLITALRQPLVAQAIRLSLITSLCTTVAIVMLGLPLAYLLAMHDFPGKRLVEAIVDLPMVLPPTVAGVGLLLAFGRTGLLGSVLRPLGIAIPFTTFAVVLAQTFVAAPFFITAAAAGLREVERRYLDAAATLRGTPAYTFWRVLLPLSARSLVAGAAMSWARALGEFGATITFAGNLQGRTQTMPLAVYIALQTDLDAAVALSVILLIVSLTILIALRSTPFGLNTRTRALRRSS